MKKIYLYNITILRVVDPDTLEVIIDLGFKMRLWQWSVRLDGIDCPEIHSPNSTEVTAAARIWQHVRQMVPANSEATMESTTKPDKYGRCLGRVILADGTCLNDHLVAKGYAKSYHGDTKQPWTDEELQKIINS